jgi:hypothetical protein
MFNAGEFYKMMMDKMINSAGAQNHFVQNYFADRNLKKEARR